MDLKNFSIALFVKDIKVAKDFYTNILQQEVDLDFGKNIIFKAGFALWEILENQIIPKTLGMDKITDKRVNRFELYFETEDLRLVYENLKSKNVRFLHEVHEESWGQQTIRFFDPDNHLVEIGESLKRFISRMYNQGLTVEQVFERTHVPVEKIKRLLNNG